MVEVDGRSCGAGFDIRKRTRLRHMWSVPSSATTSPPSPSQRPLIIPCPSSPNSCFLKDGRQISVGECALFKLARDSPTLVGIIRSLTSDKETCLRISVNWLYRPAEVKLVKGVALEAAPNEVFYTFHRDEIPAASFLHRCKVAFLPEGVELPAGVSSFVCRRVYDVTNSHLWWLTDKDYADEWQEEVDQLLDKTVVEMHVSVEQQLDSRSPKTMNGSAATSPQKHSPDSVQNSGSNFSSQSKGRKRDRGDRSSEPIKRERSARTDRGDSGQLRSDSMWSLEIAKLTEKGLVSSEAVARLLRFMQPEKSRRKIDLTERTMLAGVIAATDNHDCLIQFVQLKGVPLLDEWLQDVHKGEFGKSGNIKYSEKVVEDFLLVLLGALDKLPVNLSALQMCNIGKSVNHLRSYKNSEIQKKARSLVDIWKKRVEAEMNISDSKSGSAQTAQWPCKLRDGSHGGNKQSGGSSETAIRCSAPHQSSPKPSSVKNLQRGFNSKPGSAHQSNVRPALSPAPATFNYKDGQIRTTNGGSVEVPQAVIREDKSCSSSQSHTNSQCSSDHVRSRVSHGKEDPRNSSTASNCFNKVTGSGSKHKKSANGGISGVIKESISNRGVSVGRTSFAEKVSLNPIDGPVHEGNPQKLIVKIPNRGRGSAQSAQSGVGASADDISGKTSRVSSPAVSGKHELSDTCLRRKHDSQEFDEVDGSSATVPLRPSDTKKSPNIAKSTSSPRRNEKKLRKTHGSSFNTMNALIESCVKFSEPNALMAPGDDVGMNLLASVAGGEICEASSASPTGSPHKNSRTAEKSTSNERTNEKEVRCDDVLDQGKSPDVDSDECNIASCATKVNVEDCPKHAKTAGVPLNEESCLRKKGVSGEQIGCTTASNVTDGGALVCNDKGREMTVDSHSQLPVSTQTVGNGVEIEPKIKNTPLIDDSVKKTYQDSVFTSVDCEDNVKPIVCSVPKTDCSVERNSGAVPLQSFTLITDDKPTVQHPVAVLSSSKPEKVAVDIRDFAGESTKKRFVQENGSSELLENQEDPRVHSPVAARDTDGKVDNSDMKEASVQQLGDSGPQVSSSGDVLTEELHSISKEVNVVAHEGETKGDSAAGTVDAVFPPASEGLVEDVKLGFDLNEGLNLDDGKYAEAVSSCPVDICSANPLQVPVSSASDLLASVAVSEPARGPFVPHVDLLRNEELGWKGFTANSAFHLSEPRNIVELPQGPGMALRPDSTASSQVRLPLDIDLNVADESYGEEFDSKYNAVSKLTAATSLRGSGGLDLDLNKADEASNLLHQYAGNSVRLDASTSSVKPLPSSSFLNGVGNCKRGFDLNDGPAVEELPFEQTLHNQPMRSSIPLQPNLGPRITCPDAGNLFSWYPPGTSYSTIMTPSASHDRQAFPVVGTGVGPHRIIGGPTSSLSFNPDALRGSVLSSSPAMPFQTTAFQYPVFPFGTSFTVPTSALGGGPSGYVDAAATGRIAGFPSQLAGNTAAVSFQYPHSYAISHPDNSCNGTLESNQKFGKQGLDLNFGPGYPSLEERNDLLPTLSRQVSIVSSQPPVEEQARMYGVGGGALKRKEREGGWSVDKLNSRESW